jgi:hypothetical protein
VPEIDPSGSKGVVRVSDSFVPRPDRHGNSAGRVAHTGIVRVVVRRSASRTEPNTHQVVARENTRESKMAERTRFPVCPSRQAALARCLDDPMKLDIQIGQGPSFLRQHETLNRGRPRQLERHAVIAVATDRQGTDASFMDNRFIFLHAGRRRRYQPGRWVTVPRQMSFRMSVDGVLPGRQRQT